MTIARVLPPSPPSSVERQQGPIPSVCLFPASMKRALEGQRALPEPLLPGNVFPPRGFKLQPPPSIIRAGSWAPSLWCEPQTAGLALDRDLSLHPSGRAGESKIKYPPVPALRNAIHRRARKRSGGCFTSSLRNVYTEDLEVNNAYSIHAKT